MKVALITGASGSIGQSTVKKFIENDFFVVGAYNKDKASIDNLCLELEKNGKRDYFLPVKADLSIYSEVENLYNITIKNFKKVDVLVNNAGIDFYGLILDTTEKIYDDIFNINVKAPYFLSKLCLKQMIEREFGKIVFVSSIWGKVGGSMETAYSASKSALIGLTKALAKEVSSSNINVNCICPGVIDTPMNDIFSKEEKQELKDRTPLKRMGTPDEIGELIYLLSSEKMSFITGEVLTADGGFTL